MTPGLQSAESFQDNFTHMEDPLHGLGKGLSSSPDGARHGGCLSVLTTRQLAPRRASDSRQSQEEVAMSFPL